LFHNEVGYIYMVFTSIYDYTVLLYDHIIIFDLLICILVFLCIFVSASLYLVICCDIRRQMEHYSRGMAVG
jgi:hypothetical protein